jgi:hypothetical protein
LKHDDFIARHFEATAAFLGSTLRMRIDRRESDIYDETTLYSRDD